MSLIARVRSWLRVSSRRGDFEREMQDEMRAHLELYQADLRRRGVPEEEARRRALAEFGSVAARKEDALQAASTRHDDLPAKRLRHLPNARLPSCRSAASSVW